MAVSSISWNILTLFSIKTCTEYIYVYNTYIFTYFADIGTFSFIYIDEIFQIITKYIDFNHLIMTIKIQGLKIGKQIDIFA